MTEVNPRKLLEGLGFLEGPLALDDGSLMVTDIGAGAIIHIDTVTGAHRRFAAVPGGPSALAAGPDGLLYVCSGTGISFTKDVHGRNVPAPSGTPPTTQGAPGIYTVDQRGRVEEFALHANGRPLVSPNDLVFDSTGGFYFTDHGHVVGDTADLGGLYYVPAGSREVRELVRDPRLSQPPTGPNGVALSPDEQSLYVAETSTGRVWQWNVLEPGVIGPPDRVESGTSARMLSGQSGYYLFDSMAVDSAGFLVVATLKRGGLTVIAPDGSHEEFIEIPGSDPRITNIAFGGNDLRTAYVTGAGAGAVWALDWPRPGLRLPFHGRFTPVWEDAV